MRLSVQAVDPPLFKGLSVFQVSGIFVSHVNILIMCRNHAS